MSSNPVAPASTPASAPTTRGYLDFAGFARLRGDASRSPSGAVREAAQQFEATFLQMMLSSMREAGFKSDLTDRSGEEMYMELMDREIAVQMSRRRSFGVADMIERQLAPALAAPATSAAQVLGAREAARTSGGMALRPVSPPLDLARDSARAFRIERQGALPLAPRGVVPAAYGPVAATPSSPPESSSTTGTRP
jgi:flagellar protein FlgJ